MDMHRHLRRWLNDKALREKGGTYEGRIVSVTEEVIRNRFTAQKQREPVITFEDGWRLLPNISQRRALIECFGADTEEWTGQKLVVYLTESQKTNPDTGVVRTFTEKRVKLPLAVAERRRA